jgi:hypothetical protein
MSCIGETKNAYKILAGKPNKKRTRREWEDNIKIGLKEKEKSRDSSVGIELGYGLDDRGSRV